MALVSINFFLTKLDGIKVILELPVSFFFLVELQNIFVSSDGFYPIYWCIYKGINIYCACVKIYFLVIFMLNVWQKGEKLKTSLFAKKKKTKKNI